MTILEFDTEGITSCPMNETATILECWECKYCKTSFEGVGLRKECIYEDVFVEDYGVLVKEEK